MRFEGRQRLSALGKRAVQGLRFNKNYGLRFRVSVSLFRIQGFGFRTESGTGCQSLNALSTQAVKAYDIMVFELRI